MFISPDATPSEVAKTINGQLDNDNLRLLPAIALNKLAIGALPTGITVASANIVDGTILNVDVNDSAAIAISKTTLGTYTAWAAWTPTFTGFSADPNIIFARYTQIGKLVFAVLSIGNGTSNATGFTFSIPVAANAAFNYETTGFPIVNNGVAGMGRLVISNGGPATLYRVTGTDFANLTWGATWTNSGNKGLGSALVQFLYESA